MEFDDKLKKAIERGHRRASNEIKQAEAKTLSEDELKGLHTKYRLQFSEHIEECIRRLPQHFPGFVFETIYGERGWGAGCQRDDVRLLGRGRRENLFSRLEITVRPYSAMHVVELAAKGTVNNKEVFTRQHFQKITDVDVDEFLQQVDAWILQYAELYASKN